MSGIIEIIKTDKEYRIYARGSVLFFGMKLPWDRVLFIGRIRYYHNEGYNFKPEPFVYLDGVVMKDITRYIDKLNAADTD